MPEAKNLVQLSGGDGPTVHRYYDVPLESPSGERIVYFQFDAAIPGPGLVVVAERDGTNAKAVYHVEGDCLGHVGAQQLWLDERTIACEARGADDPSSVIIDLAAGSAKRMEGKIRAYHEPTRQAVVMGGDVPPDADAFRRVQRRLIEVVRLDGGDRRAVAELHDAAAVHPREREIDVETMNFMNAKWSPAGRRFFVVFTDEIHARMNQRTRSVKSLILVDADTGRVSYLGEFTHHPMWTPDGEGVIAHVEHNGGQDLVRYDLDAAGRARVLVENFVGVHTSLSADATQALTDAFDMPEPNHAAILLYDLATGRSRELFSGPHEHHGHSRGTHPHPQWSRDGERIYFNHACAGLPQLYMMQP
jgi:hypothetical protein